MILKWLFPGPPTKGDATSRLDNFEEARKIWQEFVPKVGQADTIQGELLRAVEKLRDGAIRNGNGNWDEGFEMLLSYLEEHLLDAAVFSPDVLSRAAAILDRLHDWRSPLLEDGPYDFLADRVVDYYHHYGSRPHQHNPALLR